jgi:hypothetical protein
MPKNIILLSDGTGNSAAKLFKTNVWRLYESLDLRDPRAQVACYDDGVGTSTFLPLAVLGGALGFGLKRNVLRLYRFLCEHYEPGDRIYAFGFSRGAFTIRVLVGLILDQGVIRVRPPQAHDEERTGGHDVINGGELRRYARWAYRRFRRLFTQTGGLVTAGRWLRDRVLRARDEMLGYPSYDDVPRTHVPEIEFLGLWDTVDAYGLPMDELTMGVDRWIWPLMMPEQRLSPRVNKACHALALDDERQTFHPVLWDEADEPQDAITTDDERVTQVWFAGAHANVGGGYPNDTLSFVSLNWMADEARKRQVRFLPDVLEATVSKRDVFGRVYDSRRGLAVSYRYMPRPILQLTNGQVHERGFFGGTWPRPEPTVTIRRPKIHESVFARISAAPESYAPIALPARYAIVADGGAIADGPDNPYEHPNQSRWRAQAQERAWNLVWWRRIWYFVAVVGFLVFAAIPFRGGADEIAETARRGGATRAIEFVGGFLPEMAAPWRDYYAARPRELIYLLTAIAMLTFISSAIRARISNHMREIWGRLMFHPVDPEPPPPVDLTLLSRVRANPYYQGTWAVFRRKALPAGFALVIVVLVVGALNRGAFEVANLSGALCKAHPEATLRSIPDLVSVTRTFATRDFCYASGLRLEAGQSYRLTVAAFDAMVDLNGLVADGSIVVPTQRGFTFTSRSIDMQLATRTLFAVAAPFRRLWRANWYVPVARVGANSVDQEPLVRDTLLTPRDGGELFLFMNDAIAPLAPFLPFVGWDAYYANNHGRVTVTIERLSAAEMGPASAE